MISGDVMIDILTDNGTLILAAITAASVWQSRKAIKKNGELVEANKEAVEETRKDHRRDSIKDLIVELETIKSKIPKPRSGFRHVSSGPFAVSRPFEKLDEWEPTISRNIRSFIREETTSDSPNLLENYDEYKRNYENYSQKRNSIKRSISSFLEIYYDTIDWTQIEIKNEGEKVISHQKMTTKEAKQEIRNNSEKIAQRIIEEGMVFSGRKSKDLSKDVYNAVEDRFSEEFEYLRKFPYELESQYEDLVKSNGIIMRGQIDRFIQYLRRKYSIPEPEVDQEVENKNEDNQEPESTIVETEEEAPLSIEIANIENIRLGTIYLRYTEYDKERDDIDREDYETRSEYYTAREEETPGSSYDLISVLPNGWVKCTNREKIRCDPKVGGGEEMKQFIDLYPPNVIERIKYSETESRDQ